MMITKEKFERMKKYSQTSSWAIWHEITDEKKAKSGVGILDVFEDKNICNILNDKYVLVGLNESVNYDEKKSEWSNFHSKSPYHNDFRLRYALKDTVLWGSYMTDIYKNYNEKDSKIAVEYIENNLSFKQKCFEIFKSELVDLGGEPILITFGNDTRKAVLEFAKLYNYDINKIKPVLHYSYFISKEDYKKKINELINSL